MAAARCGGISAAIPVSIAGAESPQSRRRRTWAGRRAFTRPARLGKVLIPQSNSRVVRSKEGLRRGARRAGSARSFPRRG